MTSNTNTIMQRKRALPPGMWQRGRTYFARFRAQGRVIRKRLSTDFRAASEMLNDLRARADKLEFGLVDNDYAWADLKKEFLKWAQQAVRRPKEYEADLNAFEAATGAKNVREIDTQLVIRFRAARLVDKVSARTINRQVGTVHNLLNHGVQWKRIGSNPISDLKPLANDAPRKVRRALSAAEVQAIFDASPPELRTIWKLLMTTGLRRNEVVSLKFKDIDFEGKVAVVQAAVAKNHRQREVPLDDGVLADIVTAKEAAKLREPVPGSTAEQTAQQKENFSKEHVFVTRANTPLKNNLLRQFYGVCKRAGIEGAGPGGSVDIHSLRVSFISLAIAHGANPKAVQVIVGHSTLSLTMNVYAKATDKSKREAIGVLPFATVSGPGHLLSLPNAHEVRTSAKQEPQSHTA